MNEIDLITIIFAIILIPSYIFYLIVKRKENTRELEEIETTNKILLALKEYAKKQPDFANILHKFGLL